MLVTDEMVRRACDAYWHPDVWPILVGNGRDHMEHMRAALTAALSPGWRPIEEARGVVVSCYSKDSYGPRIIAYPGRGGGVVTARWWQHTDGTCNFLDDGGNAIYPEVFMPLPAPPVQQKEGV